MLLPVASFVVGLLPFIALAKVHKLKLQKLTPTANNPEFEAAWLAEKYGAPSQVQLPLFGAGGTGRRVRPTSEEDEPLFWTQHFWEGEEHANGGHNVPLSSEFL
jgi:saccharopepsin